MSSKKKKIPNSASGISDIEKRPIAPIIDYTNSFPCWRFSNFDKDGPWGLDALLSFKYHYHNDAKDIVISLGLQSLHKALKELDGKEITDRRDFWDKLKSKCNCDIPIDVVEKIEEEMIYNAFVEKIYPKLLEFEKITWDEIRLQTHYGKGKMKSNNHEIDISDLSTEAQRRLKLLKFDDRDKIYSLRLEGTIRIFGFKELNYLDIIWVDMNHKVCIPKK